MHRWEFVSSKRCVGFVAIVTKQTNLGYYFKMSFYKDD